MVSKLNVDEMAETGSSVHYGYHSPGNANFSSMPDSMREIILQIKENVDIVQVIGQYIPLKKAGSRYLGLCPFHQDRTPSLNVSPQMNIFKCFSCGAGGDVLKFVQDYEKLDFMDALRLLADKASIVIPEKIQARENSGEKDKSSLILQANQFAGDFYQTQLKENPAVLKYLHDRGMTPEVVKHFQLGYAPENSDSFLAKAAQKKLPVQALMDAGLLLEHSSGRSYARFRNRLVFPIWNMSGHIIGFGARVLKSDDMPKYLNSPETPFYHKSKVLYGINFARVPMDAAKEVILVEGYMDLLALWQAGFTNVVAVSGTALTREHAQILARFAKRAYLFFDGDEAGRKAVLRSLEPLLTAGMEIRAPHLPPGEDPDSFVCKFGAEKTQALFAGSDNLIELLTRSLAPGLSPEEKEQLLKHCLETLAFIPSYQVKQDYFSLLSKKFGLKSQLSIPKIAAQAQWKSSPTEPKAALGKAPLKTMATGVIIASSGSKSGLSLSLEWQLLQLLISSESVCISALENLKLEWLQEPTAREIIDHLLAFVEEHAKLDISLFLEMLSEADKNVLGSIHIIESPDVGKIAKQYFETVSALELRYIQRLLTVEKDKARHIELQKRIQEINNLRREVGNHD